jgi:hypothetical protein
MRESGGEGRLGSAGAVTRFGRLTHGGKVTSVGTKRVTIEIIFRIEWYDRIEHTIIGTGTQDSLDKEVIGVCARCGWKAATGCISSET